MLSRNGPLASRGAASSAMAGSCRKSPESTGFPSSRRELRPAQNSSIAVPADNRPFLYLCNAGALVERCPARPALPRSRRRREKWTSPGCANCRGGIERGWQQQPHDKSSPGQVVSMSNPDRPVPPGASGNSRLAHTLTVTVPPMLNQAPGFGRNLPFCQHNDAPVQPGAAAMTAVRTRMCTSPVRL